MQNTSPRRLCNSVVRSGAAPLWLDTWSFTEIQACARLKADRKDFLVEADHVAERFRLFGGVPRFVLEQARTTVDDAVQQYVPGGRADLLNVSSFHSRASVSHRLLQARVRMGAHQLISGCFWWEFGNLGKVALFQR